MGDDEPKTLDGDQGLIGRHRLGAKVTDIGREDHERRVEDDFFTKGGSGQPEDWSDGIHRRRLHRSQTHGSPSQAQRAQDQECAERERRKGADPGANNARRITFEYVMIKDKNDSDADARELVRLLRHYKLPAKVNLIPFNPWPGAPYECSSWERIEGFADILSRAGYASPIRTPRGRDIFAACGQLKSESVKKRASEVRKERMGV